MKAQLEVIPHQFNSSLSAFYYEADSFQSPWHYHHEYELTYIIKSTGLRYVGTSIENFQVGDLVLIGPNLPHAWANVKDYQQGASSIYLQWKSGELTNFFGCLPEFEQIDRLLNRAASGICFPVQDQQINYGFRMMELYKRKKTERLFHFMELLHDLSQETNYHLLSDDGSAIHKSQKADDRIKRMVEYLSLNYSLSLTVDQMAELTCMTKVAFCRFFKSTFKKTFTQYLNEVRIHHVCQELQCSNAPLIDIAMQSGYSNMSYFHRKFKEIMKVSPQQYRLKFRY
ncbi:AraC family transcriptional regulator [Persicobacter psychrovividus]|uniref:AraC family transcriptional regulator n=1 Tax=Persicobacter psychrovividus TaxID=387638 RepID=A0ABM7VMP0_9BACT|nr:AraC family transcriptional regulator [Persicobacter psychrovividus]